jgi:hypothetical protein
MCAAAIAKSKSSQMKWARRERRSISQKGSVAERTPKHSTSSEGYTNLRMPFGRRLAAEVSMCDCPMGRELDSKLMAHLQYSLIRSNRELCERRLRNRFRYSRRIQVPLCGSQLSRPTTLSAASIELWRYDRNRVSRGPFSTCRTGSSLFFSA